MTKRIKSKTSTFTLTKSVKRKWLKALRSGEYKQTKGKLRRGGADSYCCLGVLCSVLGIDKKEMTGAEMPKDLDSFCAMVTYSWIDFRVHFKPKGYGFSAEFFDLSTLNDDYGYTFEQIADIIEEKVPCHEG